MGGTLEHPLRIFLYFLIFEEVVDCFREAGGVWTLKTKELECTCERLAKIISISEMLNDSG